MHLHGQADDDEDMRDIISYAAGSTEVSVYATGGTATATSLTVSQLA